MMIDDISWHREHDIRLRMMDAKLDRIALMLQRHFATGGCPMPTSPPSSSSRMGMPSARRRSWERIAAKMQREALTSLIMWVAGKLGGWLLTLTIPAIVTFGALAWKWLLGPFLKSVMEWLGPFLKWVMG